MPRFSKRNMRTEYIFLIQNHDYSPTMKVIPPISMTTAVFMYVYENILFFLHIAFN